jgi:hypothetical protein
VNSVSEQPFAIKELVLKCTLKHGDHDYFEIQASIRDGFTRRSRVPLGEIGDFVDLGNRLLPEGPIRDRWWDRLKKLAKGDWIRLVIEFPQPPQESDSLDTWSAMVSMQWERAEVPFVKGQPVRPLAQSDDPKISIVRAIAEPDGEVKVLAPRAPKAGAKRRYRHIDLTKATTREDELYATLADLGSNQFDVDPWRASSPKELEKLFMGNSDDLTVLHITGHGTQEGIPMEGEADVKLAELSEYLRGSEVQLLLLSVCYSATPGWLQAVLAKQRIPAVIGMQDTMFTSANEKFVLRLFDSLKDGKSIDEAMWAARDAAYRTGNEKAHWWWVPVLYLSRDSRRNPWFWPVPTEASEPPQDAAVSPNSAGVLPALPPPEATFDIHPGSCFIESLDDLVELFPAHGGLRARKVRQNKQRTMLSARQVSVAVDPTGRHVACAADGRFKFAPVGRKTGLPTDWITAQKLTGEVSAVHAVTSHGGRVSATVTVEGKPMRIEVDRGGWWRDLGGAGAAVDDGIISDTAAGITVRLIFDDHGQSVVVELEREVQVFRAPEGATGVNVVRRPQGSGHATGVVIRLGSRAQLWSVKTLQPTPSLP